MTLLEIMISITVLSVVFLVAASGFSSTLKATEQAKRTTSAAIFLEATVESITAQPFENLLSLNGNQVFDGTNAADSNYRTDVTVFLADINLIQINAVIRDLRTGRVVGRISTYKANS